MPRSDQSFKSSADNLKICAFCWESSATPRGVVQIAHGLAEHCLRYERFAEALNAAGFIVYANDHRGHGRSVFDGKAGNAGAPGWEGLVADLVQFNAAIKAKHPELPLFLFGHSMGSFATQQFMLDHSSAVDGVILSGSTDLGAVMQMAMETGNVPSMEAYNLPFEPARTPFDWLSRDEAEVDLYVNDPLCGFEMDEAFSMSMMMAAGPLSDAERLANIRNDLPVLLMAGDADPLNGELALLESLAGKYATAGVQKVDRQFYEGGRHEMLNETNRDEVTAGIVSWLKARL